MIAWVQPLDLGFFSLSGMGAEWRTTEAGLFKSDGRWHIGTFCTDLPYLSGRFYNVFITHGVGVWQMHQKVNKPRN